MITLNLGNDEKFDTLVHGAGLLTTLKQMSDPLVATKDDATKGHMPGLVFAFLVEVNGKQCMAQAVLTVREFTGIYSALRGRYGPGGPQAHRYPGLESPFIPYPDTSKN